MPKAPTKKRSAVATVQSAAVITIKDAPGMTKAGRRRVAAWMRKQADLLEKEGTNLSKRFTARYLYEA